MTFLFTVFSGIFGAVANASAFGGANFAFSMLTDHGEKERKRHDLALEKLQRARDVWNKDRMKQLDFISKRLREKNEAMVYINKCLSTIDYLQNKENPCRPSPSYQIFVISQNLKKW